jgi:hypothetical protein
MIKKIFFWIAGLLLIAFLAFNFLASRLINKDFIQEKIQTVFSQKIGGEVEFRKADISIFPLPHVVIHHGSFSMPEIASGSIEATTVYPKILPLFTGNFRISKLLVTAPDITMKLPRTSSVKKTSDSDKRKKELDPVLIMREYVTALLAPLAVNAPDLIIEVDDGKLNMSGEDQLSFSFNNIDASMVLPPKGLKVNITCNSNLWESISVAGNLDPEDYRGNGEINVSNFRPQGLFDYLLPKADFHVGDSKINMALNFDLNDQKGIQAEMGVSFPKLSIIRQDKELIMKGKRLKTAFRMNEKKTTVSIEELRLDYPRLEMTGDFIVEKKSQKVSLELEGKELDVLSTREATLALAGHIPVTQKIFNVLRGGSIPLITFRSHGSTVSDLKKSENFIIEGNMNDGEIYVPKADLNLKEVKGEVVIAKGFLNGKNLEARLENEKGWDGTLKLGLKGGDAPFHLDMVVRADLNQLPPLLKRLVKNEDFVREVNSISEVQGEAFGRLVLGESLQSVRAKIDVTELNLSARYQRIPYLLGIHKGQLFYDGKSIGVKDLGGNLGKSSFSELSAQIDLDEKPDLHIISGETVLSMDEIYPWLLSYKTLNETLKDFKSVQGDLSLSTIQVNGPLLKPKDWKYRMSGEVNRLSMDSTFFPDSIFVTKGKLEANEDTLTFTDLQSDTLDASFTISGALHEPFEGFGKTELTGSGTFGPKATKWLSDTIKLPSEFRVRAPLALTDAKMSRERDGKTSFEGDFSLEQGVDVSVELSKGQEGFFIHNVTLKDDVSHAELMLKLGREAYDFQFTGNVNQATLDKVFTREIFLNGWLRGDFQAHIQKGKPLQSTARGKLEGQDAVLPWILNVPLKMSSFSFTGENKKISFEPTTVMWGNSTMILTGDVNFASDWFLLDMDLAADELHWDMMKNAFAKEHDTKQDWDVPVQGALRVTTDSFTYDQLTWRPVHADVSFAADTVNLDITDARLCGISFPGVLTIRPQDVSMDFQVIAENEDLESAVLCLMEKEGLMTGSFDAKGKVITRGKGETLKQSLNGNLEFTARKGRVYRGGVLSKIFAFMNLSEMFTGTLPDMVKKGFGYKTITAQGTLQGSKLVLKEVIIDGSSMKIVSQGDVDLGEKKLDLVVLVSPLKTVDRFAKYIPVVKGITGGTVVTIPLKVTGDYEDPKITYLPASAIGSGVYGILKNTLKVPFKIIQPVMPNKENTDENSNTEIKNKK